MNRTEHKKKAMLEALENSLGVVQEACIIAGIGRTTYYNWMNNDSNFQDEVFSLKDVALDFAESKLFELITGVFKENKNGRVYTMPPNVAAIIFYLKTQGKKRGYVERFQYEIEPVDKFADMTDEELEEKLEKYRINQGWVHKDAANSNEPIIK